MNLGDFTAWLTTWLNRSDFDQGTATTIIQRATARIQREARLAGMERVYTPPAYTDGTWQQFPLPDDFIASLYMIADGVEVEPVTVSKILKMPQCQGRPRSFARLGDNFLVRPYPMQGVTLYYYGQFDPVVNPTDTNVLLSSAPEVLLWACLSYAGDYYKMDETATWEQRYQDELGKLQAQSQDADFFASPQGVEGYADTSSSFGPPYYGIYSL